MIESGVSMPDFFHFRKFASAIVAAKKPALFPLCGLLMLATLGTPPAAARTLKVGPGLTYAKPSDAATHVQDNDTVDIAAGVYAGETSTWKANGLVLRGS